MAFRCARAPRRGSAAHRGTDVRYPVPRCPPFAERGQRLTGAPAVFTLVDRDVTGLCQAHSPRCVQLTQKLYEENGAFEQRLRRFAQRGNTPAKKKSTSLSFARSCFAGLGEFTSDTHTARAAHAHSAQQPPTCSPPCHEPLSPSLGQHGPVPGKTRCTVGPRRVNAPAV